MAHSISQSLYSDEADQSLLDSDNMDVVCSPCAEDQKVVAAVGYCVDCSEHLCAKCFDHHCTPSAFRNHKLLDKTQMPQTKTHKDECTDECEIHAGEILKYFCEDHQQFVCSACVIAGSRSHKTCNVGYVPELSKDLFDNPEFKNFDEKLKLLMKRTCDVEVNARKNLMDVETYADKSIERIKQFREEINVYFDKLEKKAIDQCIRIRKIIEGKISPLVEQIKRLGDKISELDKKIIEKKDKKQKCSLYTDMKNYRTRLEKYSTEIGRLEQTNKFPEFSFSPSKLIQDFVSDDTKKFGTYDGLNIIHTKLLADKEECYIRDITLLGNDRIAVVDKNNRNVKIMDRHVGIVLTWKSLYHDVDKITSVSDHEFAVMQNGNIEIYTITNATDVIKLKATIKNTGLRDITIAYSNNKFVGVTSSSSPTIRIVDMNGAHIKTFESTYLGYLLNGAMFKAIDPAHMAIYASYKGKDMLTCLSFDGQVRAEYKPGNGWRPRGVAVSRDGTVYVADRMRDTIHILTSALKKRGEIKGEKHGIKDPLGLAICDRDHKLYVRMLNSSKVAVIDIDNY